VGALKGDPYTQSAQIARRRATKRHATEAANASSWPWQHTRTAGQSTPRTADRDLCAESAQVA